MAHFVRHNQSKAIGTMFQALPLLILMILQGLGSHSGANTQSLEVQLRLQNRFYASVIKQEREQQELQAPQEEAAKPKVAFIQPASFRECTKLKQSGFATSLRSRDGPTS